MNGENILKLSFRQINSNYVLLLVCLLVPLVSTLSWNLSIAIDSKVTVFVIRLVKLCIVAYIHCGVLALFYQSLKGVEVNLKMLTSSANRYLKLYVAGLIGIGIFSVLFVSLFLFFVSRVEYGMTGYVFEPSRRYFVMIQANMLITSVFTMYATAFVFTKNRGMSAVVDGIKYLLMNLKKSIPLLAFNLVGWIIVSAILFYAIQLPEGSKGYSCIVFLSRMLTCYITFTIYIGACFILMSEGARKTKI